MSEAAQQQGGPGPGRNPASGGAGGPPLDLAALQNSPAIGQIRQIIRRDPTLVQPLLQNFLEANPELARTIGPEVLMQLLVPGAGGEGMEGDVEEGGIPPGAINLTTEDRDAIDRLIKLGFPRETVIQAYLACGKDEELTANQLFPS